MFNVLDDAQISLINLFILWSQMKRVNW